ncbi:MAG: ABC transporter ATP-binding protein [Burkholderiales bacterium]|nr:ABC transporter ATP-binding protein [Burkholderiales bacterium]
MNPIVRVTGVSKEFLSGRDGSRVQALDGIDLSIGRGEFVAVVGPSGCGKSTLLSLIAGFAAPSAGTIEFDSRPVTGPGPERGVMFQEYALFPWRTVEGNVEFGPYARGVDAATRRARARSLIELVGLSGFEKRFPHELSGGMRQRCALARMLANEPALWLMDEPLAAVDLQTRIILQDELLRLWGDGHAAAAGGTGKVNRPTVLFVTHGIDEAVLLADRVLVLARRPGRIKEVVTIDLPRPRAAQRNTPAMARLIEHVWSLIRDEAVQAISEESG